MSRRRRPGLAPSLFPFLAVLVCTLGTLILLLALVAKDAEDSTAQMAQQQHDQALHEAARVAQQERWRSQQLQQLRDQQTDVLEQRRSELAHVEDHLRRVKQELASLQTEIKATVIDDADQEKLKQEIQSLTEQIEREKQELAEKEQHKTTGRARVAIIPYRGPNGTQRRPIYLECVEDRIILQPEGVEITIDQLRGPTGLGNPLDSALRAIRNYWEVGGASGGQPPYPLLIVRPNGILAYTAARISMSAWDDQFGYELVPGDVELAYPTADPVLAERTAEVVANAVERRKTMISAVPSQYRKGLSGSDPVSAVLANVSRRQSASGSGTGDTFGQSSSSTAGQTSSQTTAQTASHSGGQNYAGQNYASQGDSAGVDGPMKRWQQDVDSVLNTTSTPVGSGAMSSQGDGQSASGTMNAEGNVASSGTAVNDDLLAGDGFFGRSTATSGGTDSRLAPSSNMTGSSATSSTSETSGASGASEYSGSFDGQAQYAQSSLDAANASASGSASGDPASAWQDGQSDTAGGESGDPSNTSTSTSTAGTSMAGAGGSATSGQTMPQSGTTMTDPGAEQPPMNQTLASTMAPIASQRGAGWAMDGLEASGDATSVVRNVNVGCYGNRFVILGDSISDTKVVLIDPADPSSAAIRLAQIVRSRVEGWGMAITGGNWQPVLRAVIAPGGDQSFEQLRTLLDQSGIVVESRHVESR